MKRILVIGIVLLLTFPLIKGGAKANALSNGAKVLYVGGSGPGNYSRIQDAINDANDGDTVFVYDDSSPYHESIVVNKSINLIGENKNTTIIDGSGYWNGIIISADRVNVSGFKIINFGYGYGQGAAISVRSSYCCIKDNIVMDNPGDGIQVFYGSCNLISNNDVINNRGEGINIYKSDKNLIDHNYIESNYRGVFVNEGHHNLVSNNTIVSNGEGGIQLTLCSKHNVIIHNDIMKGSVGVFIYCFSAENNVIENNISKNKVGVDLINCWNNVISHNNFIWNFRHAHFCEVSPSKNCWNENYWDNWRLPLPKPILGGDCGLSIFPYLIDFDWHPLTHPYEWWKD